MKGLSPHSLTQLQGNGAVTKVKVSLRAQTFPRCAAQTELNKKKEYEVARLRKDIEEMRIQQESLVTGMKKKQQDSMTEMNEQCDQLTKMKSK